MAYAEELTAEYGASFWPSTRSWSGRTMDPAPNQPAMDISPSLDVVFGSRTAGQVMLFLEYYGEGHTHQIARAFDISPSMVHKQLTRFESGGLLVARTIGRTRVFTWNPRNQTARHLRPFLRAELDALPKPVIDRYFRERNRPRATGKGVDYVRDDDR